MRPSLLIGISLVLGAFAAFLVAHKYTSSASGPRVVIASSTIQAGTELTNTQLQVLNWPSKAVPKGVCREIKDCNQRIARKTIESGELILESKLASIHSKGGLPAMITSGKRAISVRVNDVVGIAGFALPGSYIDVLVSAKDASGRAFSKIVLNRVKVLVVTQDPSADPKKPKIVNAVTLELTPEETEQLDLARSIGSLSLALRNELDTSISKSIGIRLVDLTQHMVVAQEPATSVKNVSKTVKITTPTAKNTRVEEIRGIK